MSGLYTRFMEWIMPFLETNWQLFLFMAGLLFLLGAIFRWKWVCDPQGERWAGLSRFCLSELWRKRVSHPAGNQRSCHYPVQRGAVGTDVKSMIEKENDHGTVWI
ncbi:MAG: Imm17 family immunity protein [Enterocloster bolteae]